MEFIDFFAGVGGFRRGLELAGHKCVGFCEFDRFAVASYTYMHLITDEQREQLEKLTLKQRQKEILKEEYRNGEWYANDIRNVDAGSLPAADCWCFGAPCQDFSIAGKRAGLDGDRSSLIREIFRLLEEQKEQDRPEWLIYENVKGMLSSNKGLDYLSILSEMDRLGYDIEWQNINSKWFVPQNRERIYTIGHLRRYGRAKILPVTGADGENNISIIAHRDGYRRNTQTFSADRISENICKCLNANDQRKVFGAKQERTMVSVRMNKPIGIVGGLQEHQTIREDGISPSLTSAMGMGGGQTPCVFLEQSVKPKQGDGIYVEMPEGFIVYAIWYEKEQCYITIRKLTPKECFRLQGWTDDYFEKAQFVNSDSQLYKQAGNGVTVDVVKAIGDKIC